MMGKIWIGSNHYEVEAEDNPEIEKKVVEFWQGGFRNQFPEIDNADDAFVFAYYMRKIADEFIDIMIQTLAEEEGWK